MNKADQNRSLIIIWTTIFIDLMGLTLIIPYINDFVADLGGDEQVVGFLLASYAVMQFLFAPMWGRISDRIGRRPVIVIGLAASAVAFTIFGMANQLWLLFASRMLAGFANANISTAQAYVADITPPKERAAKMGLVGAAFNLGFIVGFPIGGILSSAYGNSAPAFFAATISLVNCLAALAILPESYPVEKRIPHKRGMSAGTIAVIRTTLKNLITFWQKPALSRILSAFFLFTIAFSIIHVTFVEYGRDILEMTPRDRGFVFMYLGIIGALTQAFLVRRMVRRFGESRVVEIGLVIMALGLGLIPFLPTLSLLYVGTTLIALGNSLVTPAVTAIISIRSSEGEQGTAMGVTQSMGSLGRILGPPFGGITYARISYRFPFLAAAGAALIALAIYAGRPKISP
jgi:multidrug resistance protein